MSDVKPENTPPAEDTSTAMPEGKANPGARKRFFLLLLVVVLIAAAAYGGWWYLHGSHYISTDNAYTQAETAQVTPAVGGTVAAVDVSDTQLVHKGDVLVRIDDSDAKIALAQAQAQLDAAIRQVRGYYANDKTLLAQVDSAKAAAQQANAQLEAAKADYSRASTDLARRQKLRGTGSISGDELTKVENAYNTAKANLDNARAASAQAQAQIDAAEGQRAANTVMIDNTTVEQHPDVAQARAKLDAAKLDLERTLVRAPIDGIVAKRSVQIGQRIQAGTPLLSVVPVSDMYVDANFKEDELTDVRVGQSVTLTSDLYGEDVVFHGKVTGLSGGTGSAFAAIPAQNATGNWIKVVQRLPVRITLDPQELAQHPLRVGLSMEVSIDTDASVAGH